MSVRMSGDFGTMSDNSPASPLTPSSTGILDTPSTPHLEISEIEGKPFSTNFDDLLEGLGLHPSFDSAHELGRKGLSNDVAILDLPDIDDMMASSEWRQRCTDFNSNTRRAGALSIIHEEFADSPAIAVPTAHLAEFEFDFDAFDSSTNGNMNSSTVCVRRDTGKKYLMKRKRAPRNTCWTEQAILETLKTSDFQLIDCVRWSFHSGEHSYIIMDHLTNGNIEDLINTNGPLASHQAIFYASEITCAISHLHTIGISHRNINHRNILINGEGHILLTDLSYGRYTSQATVPRQLDVDISSLDKTLVVYHAPEILLRWAHDSAVDCWSFGMLLYFLMFGSNPFDDQGGSHTVYALRDRILHLPISVDSMRLVHPMARDLILKCLERNPSIRWNMEQIKGHSYFASVDWNQVSSMQLEVPVLGSSPLVRSPPSPVDVTAAQCTYAPLITTIRDSERHLPLGFGFEPHSRPETDRDPNKRHSVQDTNTAERFRPLSRVLDIVQEDEPVSVSGSIGHLADDSIIPRRRSEDALTKTERISRFWDEIDREESRSVHASAVSLEFGGSTGIPPAKTPKLRKHHSAMQARNRLFNISTSSFHKILRKKPRSSGALREAPKKQESEVDLPMGVHYMGSGIGFTYNVPAAAPSKISICSIVPQCHIFSRRFSVPFNRGHAGVASHSNERFRSNVKHQHPPHIEFNLPSRITEPIEHHPNSRSTRPTSARQTRDAGNATFIRDMYRSPGYIIAPPESMPSPMPLVNDTMSPARPTRISVSSEPLTPVTLVDGEDGTGASDARLDDRDDDCHINIVIPKNIGFEIDFPYSNWARGSTLRLVPQPTGDREQSYDDSADISMCTLAARVAV